MSAERSRPPKRGKTARTPKRSRAGALAELGAQRDDAHAYRFTYDASRHERVWIMDSLGAFHEMHWFDDVLRLLEGGKEASVYQCTLSPHSPVGVPYLAAKVYRPRRFRNLKNDFFYREGRADLDIHGNVVLDDGMQHAMRKRTQYGRELLHTSWIGHGIPFGVLPLRYSVVLAPLRATETSPPRHPGVRYRAGCGLGSFVKLSQVPLCTIRQRDG